MNQRLCNIIYTEIYIYWNIESFAQHRPHCDFLAVILTILQFLTYSAMYDGTVNSLIRSKITLCNWPINDKQYFSNGTEMRSWRYAWNCWPSLLKPSSVTHSWSRSDGSPLIMRIDNYHSDQWKAIVGYRRCVQTFFW